MVTIDKYEANTGSTGHAQTLKVMAGQTGGNEG